MQHRLQLKPLPSCPVAKQPFRPCFERRRGRPVRRAVWASAASELSHLTEATDNVPVVKIDNVRDPFATVVTLKFGNKSPEPLDTMDTLRRLGLNIVRAKMQTNDPESRNRFYVTDASTSEKIVKSERLEEIRLAVLENLMKSFPETTDQLNAGHRVKLRDSRDPTSPLGPKRHLAVDTEIVIKESEAGNFSEVYVTTDDRSGLLVDVVRVLKGINVNVVSAEVDTIGLKAQQELLVTYHGEPLNDSMREMVRTCLQYFLSLEEVETDESY